MNDDQVTDEEAVVDEGGEGSEAAEKEAKLYGWNPNYEGPGRKTAEEFLEEGKRINGFLRKDLDKLRSAIGQKDNEITELRQTMREFAAFHQETERKAYERAIKDLKDERKDALREGDGAKVVEIEEQIDQLNDAAPKPQTSAAPKYDPAKDPVWTGWLGENEGWYLKESKRRAIANGYGDLLRQEQPDLVGRPFLDEIKTRLQEDFPDWFENTERKRPSSVGGSGETRGGGNGKTYANLPAEAKLACDKFVAQKLVTREEYVKEFFGE